jgi:hypothetical protein
METAESSPTTTTTVPSEKAVSVSMQQGLQDMVLQTAAGVVIGGLAGIVLARGGSGAARKAMAGFGGGVGFGAAWTRTSMNLEELLFVDPTPPSSEK